MKTSRSAQGLAARILAVLDVGPRPAQWFRSFAATDAIFEQAIGRLFLAGRVTFKGKTTARRLVRTGR